MGGIITEGLGPEDVQTTTADPAGPSLMGLAGTIGSFSSVYTVTRRAANGFGSDGRARAPTTSTLTVQAMIVPLRGKDILRLPEGMRTTDAKVIFTPTQLYSQEGTQNPDRISINGDTYEVQMVENWALLGSYYRVLVVKVAR